MKLKNILILCTVFCTMPLLMAQENSQGAEDEEEKVANLPFKDRLTFNVGGGLMFGTYTNINIQPQIGYRITNNLTSGLGGNFQYFKNAYLSTDPFLIYGGSAFTRYRLSQNLFTQAEYQVLQYNGNLGEYGLIGGGYMSPDGFYVSAFYLIKAPAGNANAYGVPYVIRFGFGF
jgi:hypothetical protein